MDDESDDPRFEDEDAPQPEVARIRRKVHSAGRDGRVRSKTIAPKRLTRDERRRWGRRRARHRTSVSLRCWRPRRRQDLGDTDHPDTARPFTYGKER